MPAAGLAAWSAPPGLTLPRPLVAPPIPDPPKPAPGVADCRAPQRTSGTKLVLDTEGD